jgi:hypothetical protein
MAFDPRKLTSWLGRVRCCPPPPAVTGLAAQPGGGSGEVVVTWDPLPASTDVAFYRVYERKGAGTWWQLAIVDDAALDVLIPGKVGLVDASDYWPWPTIGTTTRCYVVTAVSRRGLEGPMPAEVCAPPP